MRPNFRSLALTIALALSLPSSSSAVTGSCSIVQALLVAAGGSTTCPIGYRMTGSCGLPAAGRCANGTFTVTGGFAPLAIVQSLPMADVLVQGTVDDPGASVMVNGDPVALSNNAFSATLRLTVGVHDIVVSASDAIGNAASVTRRVYVDPPAAKKEPRFSIPVTGPINDATATVMVNGVTATIANGAYLAQAVPLVTGYNRLTAVAEDAAHNRTEQSVSVFVPMVQPPAMPTVGTVGLPPPAVTTANTVTLSGTKTPGTSIWINGQQIAAVSSSTTWTVDLPLVEGDNDFAVIARDASGASSVPVHINIIRDTVAPVVTLTVPAKTNLAPLPLHGQVDDSRTVVTVNGVTDATPGRDFDIAVPLSLGTNTLSLDAASPNGYHTLKTYTVIRGTVPTLQAVQPAAGTKIAAGAGLSLQLTAVDAEGDPIQARFLIDSTVLTGWSPALSTTWTPAVSDAGRAHTVTLQVRDDFGGVAEKPVDVFVVRRPVDHP